METVEIKIYESIREIPLRKYQEYLAIANNLDAVKDRETLDQAALKIFCEIPLEQIRATPLKSFNGLLGRLSEAFKTKPQFEPRFLMVGTDDVAVEFGCIPNLDNMSYGEYKDLESYFSSWDTMHKALAVLYRPIIKEDKHGRYLIEPYEGSEKYSEILKDAPLAVALGVEVFFYHLGTRLRNFTMDSILKENNEQFQQTLNQVSERNGVDIHHSLNSLTETLLNLNRQARFHYTQP